MNVRLSRRVWFFLGVMVICLAMLIPTPSEFWPLNLFMAGLSLFWAILLGIEDVLGRREPTTPASWTEPTASWTEPTASWTEPTASWTEPTTEDEGDDAGPAIG